MYFCYHRLQDQSEAVQSARIERRSDLRDVHVRMGVHKIGGNPRRCLRGHVYVRQLLRAKRDITVDDIGDDDSRYQRDTDWLDGSGERGAAVFPR